MEKYHYTQTSLADRIGVTNATVSKWVLGKSEPNIKYVDAMCEAFNCTRTELVDIEQTSESIDKNNMNKRLMAYFTRLNSLGVERTLQYMEDLNPKYFEEGDGNE